MKILMVLTSRDQLGDTDRFWARGIRGTLLCLQRRGVELTLSSPTDARPLTDPKNDLLENQTPAITRFK
jgi:hypothetical protein